MKKIIILAASLLVLFSSLSFADSLPEPIGLKANAVKAGGVTVENMDNIYVYITAYYENGQQAYSPYALAPYPYYVPFPIYDPHQALYFSVTCGVPYGPSYYQSPLYGSGSTVYIPAVCPHLATSK